MQKNEIGLISKKVSVIFYNDKSEIAKYVKSFSIDLYTDKTFTSYVVKNSEITFKQPLNVFLNIFFKKILELYYYNLAVF